MSAAIELAALVRTRLLTPPAPGELATTVDLTHMEVIIDRQKPIVSLIEEAVAKATGTAIVITWEGWTAPNANPSRPRLAHRYNIAVYSQPVIDGETRPADNIIESMVLRLWHWVPDGGHAFGECDIGPGDMVPDNTYLIYDFEVTIPCNL